MTPGKKIGSVKEQLRTVAFGLELHTSYVLVTSRFMTIYLLACFRLVARYVLP